MLVLLIGVYFTFYVIFFRMVPNTEHESAPKIAMYSIRAFYLSVMTVNILEIECACMLYILHTFLKNKILSIFFEKIRH